MPSKSNPEESETPKEPGVVADADKKAQEEETNRGASNGEALSLFEEQEKREAGKGKKRIVEARSAEGSGILPPISKLMEKDPPDEPSKEVSPESAADSGTDELTVIHIKPPIILKGGHVVDPTQGVNELCDLRIANGVVEQVGPDLGVDGAGSEGVLFGGV